MPAAAAIAVLVLGPLLAGAAALVAPRAGRWLGLGTAGASLWAAVALARHVLASGVIRHRVAGWGAPLGIELRADGLAAFMLLVVALVGTAVTVYAQHYFRPSACREKHHAPSAERWFWPLWLSAWTALNALFLGADVFNLYVTLELLGFAAAALVALAGGRAALAAALRYFLVGLAGSLLYLMGVALAYASTGTVDLSLLAQRFEAGPASLAALALMTVGLLAKGALLPLHFWLPPAHADAPTPVSAALSALVVKASFVILARLWLEAFAPVASPAAAQALGALGAAAVLWGGAQALRQARLKMVVAYSTVAQIGYLYLLFPLALQRPDNRGAWTGAMLFVAAHALAKTAMFFAAGNVLHGAGHDRLRDLDGLTHALPLSIAAFGLAGASLVGLPPSGGFVAKWLLLGAGLTQGQWWWVLLLAAGTLVGATYIMRVLTHAFTRFEEDPVPCPVSLLGEGTALGLALAAVLLGLGAGWPAELLQVGAPVAGPLLPGGIAP
ncbi:MAG TPA: proton-conducting transporter membrane subunit [Thermoanaerobaculaceae bacterium]|nr:proton-conducting transporter membrane subunit [Thermoanaerobaculaceae bacterium]HRS16620.1 proton-conducting transporter membrane subunit [Thermoanaerobaculaceae bacterium]